ncbi:Ubiquitin-like-specific protease 2 [Colletotrichum tanaceti]|uniref:Ubiquitin-like-specific protease 2 n=1 Tax=Colletotrichum tanaceti TaxID=1306861 RepID=A0A4U6XL19_9PEZI|nr:Ubiquitin-like-specific protease 2 [Colletotrichum tanaceti]TKW56304.1 Ubiquitin-like-specific protease 2 [Colletotrichum tanaceti]
MNKTTRSILSGGLTGGINTLDRGKNTSQKRLPPVQHVEPPRSAKRQKTQTKDEAPRNSNVYTSGHFSPILESPTPEPAPKKPYLVDLTESQQSTDLEVVSNRSNHELTASSHVPEYRNVERAHSATASTKRPRRLRARSLKCAKPATPKNNISDDEDDLVRDEEGPLRKKHAADQPKANSRTAFHLPPGVGTAKGQPEDISDDELGSQDKTSNNRHVSSRDEEARKPRDHVTTRSRGDMTKVNFTKPRAVLRVVRAVSGKRTLDFTKLSPDEYPVLILDDEHGRLVAVDSNNESRPEYRWLEVKLALCTKIEYSTSGTPLVAISRASSEGVGRLLVLQFAQLGDATTLGLWADGKAKAHSSSVDCNHLERILNKQQHAADNWGLQHAQKPDDIKYLEHHEAAKAMSEMKSAAVSLSRPAPAQQNTPPQKNRQLLRRSMQGDDGLASETKSAPKTASVTSLNDDAKDRQTDAHPTKALPLPSRQVKQGPSRQISNPSPSFLRRKSPSPVSWVNQNPDWIRIWDDKPLIFPISGKNRASVYRDDISRLEEGEFLNDNLIGFYLRYLQANLERDNKALADRIYIMNTYFYPKLTDVKAGRGINYDGVKSWTTKIDLFSFDYIVVPVNESAHWYLAIICNPSKLLRTTDAQPEAERLEPSEKSADKTNEEAKAQSAGEGSIATVGKQVEQMSLEEAKIEGSSRQEDRPRQEGQSDKGSQPKQDEKKTEEAGSKPPSTKLRLHRKTAVTLARKQDPTEARVITLDSLGVGHSPTCGNLKSYLVREAKDKRGMDVEPPGTFGMTAKGIPEQEDHASCGAFLLGYMREFLKDPDGVVAKLVRKEAPSWDITSPAMRSELRNIIIEKRKEQNELAAEEKTKRKSNVRPSATSKSPEKGQEAEPATPRTPQLVPDAPKNPSSTVKGSPAIDHLPWNSRSSPPAENDAGAAPTPLPVVSSPTKPQPSVESEPARARESLPRTEAHRLEVAIVVTSKENGLLGPLEQRSEGPKTPDRVTSRGDGSTPVQVRTNPPHAEKRHVVDTDTGMPRMMSPLVSSPVKPTREKDSASTGTKWQSSNSELRLRQLSSSPVKSARKTRPAVDRSKKSISPSQQLLGELSSSCELVQQHDPAMRNGEKETKGQGSTAIEDEAPPKSSSHTMAKGLAETSPYFSAGTTSRPEPSPTAIQKVPKKHALKGVGEATPNMKCTLTQETVDLTT